MSIVASYRRSVKSIVHPATPTRQTARTFGEGIVIESTPVNRVAAFLPTSKPAPVVEWSELDWKRAEAFKLRAPAGMKRPAAPVAAPVKVEAPVVVEVETPASVAAPAASATAARRPIRLSRGESQVWDNDQQVWTWKRAKLAPALPTSDQVWHLAFTLGRDGIDATAPADYPADLRSTFLDGLAWGQEQLAADRQEDAYGECVEAMNRESFETAMIGAVPDECYV